MNNKYVKCINGGNHLPAVNLHPQLALFTDSYYG